VIDIGANTGLYSILACVASSQSRVVAFEPFPPVLPLLEANLRLNHLERRVMVSPMAISDTQGISSLYIPLQDHGLVESSCSLNASFKEATSGTVQVETTTLDAIVRDAGLRDVRVLKIDVESHEHSVLAGAENTLMHHRPLVFVEVLHIADPEAIDGSRERADYVDIRLRPDRAIVGEKVQHDPEAWNHLLVPVERLTDATQVLASVGLETSGPGRS
jgi:FkbM family methyltransferase